jgi:DNA repair exonuclease SbcCD ATPase subunit
MARYFKSMRGKLEESAAVVNEIHTMMEAMYRRFADEHGLRLGAPTRFSLLRYQKELDRLEEHYHTQFDTPLNLLTNEKMTLAHKFFETLASQVRRVYRYANRETERWLRSVMAPMESQVREHQLMLRRRLESVKRIHQATETLEDRVAELSAIERTLWAQLADLERFARDLNRSLDRDQPPVAAAA